LGTVFVSVRAEDELGSAFGAGASAAIGRLAGSPKRFDDGALAVDFDDETSKEEK
jgi:hypothetical protein